MNYLEAIETLKDLKDQGYITGADLKPLNQAANVILSTEVENVVDNDYFDLKASQMEKVDDWFFQVCNTINQMTFTDLECFQNTRVYYINKTIKFMDEVKKGNLFFN